MIAARCVGSNKRRSVVHRSGFIRARDSVVVWNRRNGHAKLPVRLLFEYTGQIRGSLTAPNYKQNILSRPWRSDRWIGRKIERKRELERKKYEVRGRGWKRNYFIKKSIESII